MSGKDDRAQGLTLDEVVVAAWDVVHEAGLAGLTLGAAAARLAVSERDVRTVVESERALYDAMFADAQRQFLRIVEELPPVEEPREGLRQYMHALARFAVSDAERNQLLFQRTLPGFEPSPESYAIAIEALDRARAHLRAVGITEPAHVDLLTALIGGMINQQLANDPGGDRWLLLIDEALDMYLDMRDGRRRLVTAQDAERRRIERDLHDGAQQHLVALKVQAGIVRTVAEREGAPETAKLVAGFADEAGAALDALRELAHGIYPPLLAAEGLVHALVSAATRSAIPIDVSAETLGRYDEAIEAAVYFCCLEAMQNIGKYAGASRGAVRLSVQDDTLSFLVTDDGRGFDPAATRRGSGLTNMADRLGALGGVLLVESAPGKGTMVTGRLPLGVETT